MEPTHGDYTDLLPIDFFEKERKRPCSNSKQTVMYVSCEGGCWQAAVGPNSNRKNDSDSDRRTRLYLIFPVDRSVYDSESGGHQADDCEPLKALAQPPSPQRSQPSAEPFRLKLTLASRQHASSPCWGSATPPPSPALSALPAFRCRTPGVH